MRSNMKCARWNRGTFGTSAARARQPMSRRAKSRHQACTGKEDVREDLFACGATSNDISLTAADLEQTQSGLAYRMPRLRVYTASFSSIRPIAGRTFMPSHKDSYDFHDQVGHLLRRAYQRHVSIFQE